MGTYETLLKEEAIRNYIEKHQGAESEIKEAVKQLEEKIDAEKALKKILPALTKKQITVFFSYKEKDEETALKIIDELKTYSAGRLNIVYMAELRKQYQGKPYREKIKESISEANWFFLLFPDPRDDWDWCLFETGLFAAQYTSADRLICLHHPSKKPKPIEEYEMVPAEKDKVIELLEMIFLNDAPIPGLGPLNNAIENRIPNMAKTIVKAIRKPKNLIRDIYEPWVELSINQPKNLKDISDLDQAYVVDANQKAITIFRLLRKMDTWGEFRGNLSENGMEDTRWMEDLCYVISKIANGHQYYPVQSVFKNSEGKMFRPVVCSVDRDWDTGEIETFHLIFSEDVGSVDRSAMPQELSVLANILRCAFRFRWEVLEKYGKSILKEEDVEKLENALNRIQKDWESRHVGTDEDIFNLFPELEKQDRVRKMFVQWYAMRKDDQSGTLDVAIKSRDTKQIPALLETLFPVNTEFLEMAAERFAEIVSG